MLQSNVFWFLHVRISSKMRRQLTLEKPCYLPTFSNIFIMETADLVLPFSGFFSIFNLSLSGPNPSCCFFLSICLIRLCIYINVCIYQKINHFHNTKIYQSRWYMNVIVQIIQHDHCLYIFSSCLHIVKSTLPLSIFSSCYVGYNEINRLVFMFLPCFYSKKHGKKKQKICSYISLLDSPYLSLYLYHSI